MHLPHNRSRTGFTLIEMLVVIAIIAILVSLLAAALFYVFSTGANAGAMVEISQLDASVSAFKAKFGIPVPDRMRLYSNQLDYANDPSPLARNSLTILNKMFPSIGNFNSLAWIDGVNPFVTANTKFSPNGNPYASWQFVDLEGDQCIVFFLQGIPLNADPRLFTSAAPGFGGQGFSADPKNPTRPPTPPNSSGPGRVGPFYTFTATRFMPRPNAGVKNNVANGANDIDPTTVGVASPLPLQPPGTFLSYMDYLSNPPINTTYAGWTTKQSNPTTQGDRGYTPYIYFSANGRKNGYSGYFIQLPAVDNNNGGRWVSAYFLSVNNGIAQWHNPDSWQIYSAGQDGFFNSVQQPTNGPVAGSPFQWNTNNVQNLYKITVRNRPVGGNDDITNFYKNKLGIQQ